MSIKLRVNIVVASVCLFSVLATGAVVAQDAVNDGVLLLLPGAGAAADDTADVVALDPAINLASPEPVVGVTTPDPQDDTATVVPEADRPARTTMAIPALGEETGYEYKNDDELADNAASATQQVSYLDAAIADATENGNCDGVCTNYLIYLNEERNYNQNIADHLLEEIRRRRPVQVVTPHPTPDLTSNPGTEILPDLTPVVAPASVSVRDATSDATPPEGYCAALAASGDRSDCGWRYSQTQKQ